MAAPAAARPNPVTNDMSDVLGWRLWGAFTWHSLAFSVGHTIWSCTTSWLFPTPAGSSRFSLYNLITSLFMWALQGLVLWAHSKVLSTSESPPVYMPALGLHGRGWLGVLVSRVLIRTRKLHDFISTVILFAATTGTAIVMLYAYSPSAPATQQNAAGSTAAGAPSARAFAAGYGLCLGCLYSLQHLLSCRNVLTYPPIHRHRAIQLRQQLPACVLPALQLAFIALALSRAFGYRPPSWVALPAALTAGTLCVWGWLAGHATLQVVMSEPLRVTTTLPSAAPDPVRGLLEVLRDNRPLVQELGLQELVGLAQGQAAAQRAWRSGIWADDSGRLAWSPLADFLMVELRDWAITLAGALPGGTGGSDRVAPSLEGVGRVQWNVLAASSATGTRVVSRAQDTAAWCMRARMYRVHFCLRALSGLAAASRTEDRYGIVLLSDPVLGDITFMLLSCVLVAQLYAKAASASAASGRMARVLRQLLSWVGPPAHPSLQQVELLAHGVEDTARGCLGQLVATFGPSLQSAAKSAHTGPPVGHPAELLGMLSSMLAFRE